jgi:hypothetical protein
MMILITDLTALSLSNNCILFYTVGFDVYLREKAVKKEALNQKLQNMTLILVFLIVFFFLLSQKQRVIINSTGG